MNNQKLWYGIGAIALLIIAAAVIIPALILRGINESARDVIRPFEESNQNLQTQVAKVLHPTPTIIPDPVTIIHEVRSLARLETIHYSVEKVITAEIGQGDLGFLFGDRLLLVAHGYVIGGIDLSKLEDEDLQIRGSALYVRLPEPEIFVATLENDRSYVYDRDTGLLRREDIMLETKARQAAELEIRNAAMEDGILETARVNAEVYLERLLRKLGFDEVVFRSE